MKNTTKIFNARKIVFGSLALFLCIDVSGATCTSATGTIGICVDDGEDISNKLGITWNGMQGKGEVYQPYNSGQPIQTLNFKFNGSKEANEKDKKDLVAKILKSSKTLTINGEGRGIQMDDGNGTLKISLEDNANKQIFLKLGSQEKSNNEAFMGNLTLDGANTNQFTGLFYGRGIKGNITLSAFGRHGLVLGEKGMIIGKIILQAGTTIITPTPSTTNLFSLSGGIYSNQGSGTLVIRYTDIDLFGNLSNTGDPKGSSVVVADGGQITLKFDQEKQKITVHDSISTTHKDTSQIIINTDRNNQTLSLSGIMSEKGSNGIQVNLKGENSTLTLTNQIQQIDVNDPALFEISDFNFSGSGNIETTFEGKNGKIQGQVSFSGEGSNHIAFKQNGTIDGDVILSPSKNSQQIKLGNIDITFQDNGEIQGDIYSYGGQTSINFKHGTINGNINTNGGKTKITFDEEDSSIRGIVGTESRKTDVIFKKGGEIREKVYSGGLDNNTQAENSIVFSSGDGQIGGIEVNGTNKATNSIIVDSGNLTIKTIAYGSNDGESIYVHNPNGTNSIQVKKGKLTIEGHIVSSLGKNHIEAKDLVLKGTLSTWGSSTTTSQNLIVVTADGSTQIGEQSPITLLAEGGQNILSLNNSDKNNLKLQNINTKEGRNYLGKNLIMQTNSSDSNLRVLENFNSDNLFGGTMQILKGISAEGGKNTILFASDEEQKSSIISHIDNSSTISLTLKNAISGNNHVWLDISKSTLTSTKEAVTTYLGSSQTLEDQKTLGNTAAIFGNISSNGGDNLLFVKNKVSNNKVKSALFGNILTDGGSNNILLQNSIIIPSKILENGEVKTLGGELSGNITTKNGEANIATFVSYNPFEDQTTLIYNLFASGGTTNLLFVGEINVEIDFICQATSKTNLLFAKSTQEPQSFESKNLSQQNFLNEIIKDIKQEGFKVELMGGSIHSPQAKIQSTYQTTSHHLNLNGIIVGTISSLGLEKSNNVPQGNKDSITLKSGTMIIGDIQVTSAFSTTMEEKSKIFFKDLSPSNPNNNFSLPTLKINKESSTSQSFPETTVSIATSSNQDTNFALLTIGNKDKKEVGTGLQGEGAATFMVRVNPNANQGQATLGGGNEWGLAYSDRIIIANIGNNTTAQSETYFIGFILDHEDQIENIKYDTSKDGTGNGGTKQEGNIAVLTVVNTDDKKPGIDLKPQNTQDGFSTISTTLTALPTDINGVYDKDGSFTTYFLSSATVKGVTTEAMDTSSTALSVNYDLYVATFNSLNKRMGELRDNPHSQGVWSRVFGGTQSNHFGLGTKTKYLAIQVGYDYAFGFEGANNYLGISLAYGLSSSKVQSSSPQDSLELSQLKSSLVEVGIYNAYVQDEGWYNDSMLKFSYITSNFNLSKQDTAYSTHNFAVIVGDEFGYRFKLGENKEWYIDPQLEMTLGYFNKTQLTQVLKKSWLDSLAEGLLTLRTRVGSSFAYDFKSFTHHKPFNASIYVGLFYEYDYVTDGKIFFKTNLGGESVSSNIIGSSGRVVTNVGSNIFIKDHTRVYFDIQNSFAGKITTDYQVSLGVRYSFGENTGYTPMNTTKMPLKIETSTSTEEKVLQE